MTTTAESWTIQRLLQWSAGYLDGKGLSQSPRLDAELLLGHTLSVSRVYLYTHFDRVLSPAEREPFRAALLRRGQGEPIAYILGTKEFLGHTFEVSKAVLIPRPDTEIVVETAIAAANDWAPSAANALSILDIGTGSGCIAIALALALPHARVTAWDISHEALAVAKRNAARLGVQERVTFVACDALGGAAWEPSGADGSCETFHLIVSNPPYIAHSEKADLSPSVIGFEPESALFAAEEGLIFYRQLASHAAQRLKRDGKLVLEIGFRQAQHVLDLLTAHGWKDSLVIRDLGRIDRCIVASDPHSAPKTRGNREDAASTGGSEEQKMQAAVHTSGLPLAQKAARAGASVAGDPIYVALEEPKRALLGATHIDSSATREKRRSEATDGALSAMEPERTYEPLNAFGQPQRHSLARTAPIEYVTQVLSGEEEEMLAEYATEKASDLESDA